jgi:hypothetical protein
MYNTRLAPGGRPATPNRFPIGAVVTAIDDRCYDERRTDDVRPWRRGGRAAEGFASMLKSLLVGVGLLIMVAGIVFTLQGLGDIGGSAMSGVTFWAVAGPLIALAGIVIAAVGLRRRRPAS